MNTLTDRLHDAAITHSRQIINELTRELAAIPGILINANEARLRDRNIGTDEEPQWPVPLINNGVVGLLTYKQVPLTISFINYHYADLYFPSVQILQHTTLPRYLRERSPRVGWLSEPVTSLQHWPMTTTEEFWLREGATTVTAKQLLGNIDYYTYPTSKSLKVGWNFNISLPDLTKKLESTYKTYTKLTEHPETQLSLMEALLPKYLSTIFLPRKLWFEGLPEATRKQLL